MKFNVQEDNYTLQGFLNFSKLLRTLKKSIDFVSKYESRNLLILILLATISAVVPYLQNGLFGRLIDTTIAYKTTGLGLRGILITVAFLIGVTILPNVLGLIKSFVSSNFRFNILRNLDLYFLRKISTFDIATVENTEYQELTQKASERGNGSIYDFIRFSIDNYSNFIGVLVSFIILGFIDKTLLIYAFVGSLPALYVQLRYGKDIFWIWDLNSSNRRKYFRRRSYFSGVVSLTEMKLYQLAKRFLSEITKLHDGFDDELKQAEKSKLGWELFALTVFGLFLGLGVWRIVHLTLIGQLLIGQMLFAYTTYRGFKGTLSEFFRQIGWMTEFGNYARYWFQIDEIRPKIQNIRNAEKVDFRKDPPRIEFKNVSFSYDEKGERFALNDLSFIIEPGEKLAIVGLSGAGKTTLIKLLCRIYDPIKGHILINGKDLKEIDLELWHRQLGVLFQDFVDYEFKVKEVIAFGNSEITPTDRHIEKAAKMAKANVFIERLPKKYDQLLWKGFEDGVSLSKGEKQRMALARVLYRESPITILDEPTASVDALAEQEIFDTLETLPKDKTVILISHRFSTVKNADNILVIEYGKLIEQGNHTKLMKEKGRYSELYKIQAESYK